MTKRESPLTNKVVRAKSKVRDLALSPDERFVLYGAGKTARLLALANAREAAVVNASGDVYTRGGDFSSAAFSPDSRLAAFSIGRTVYLYNVPDWREQERWEDVPELKCVAFSPDARLLAIGGHTLRLWDFNQSQITTFKVNFIECVAFSPAGCQLLIGCGAALQLWQIEPQRLTREFAGHKGLVNSVAFSPDGLTALSGSQERVIRLWELASGKQLQQFEGHKRGVRSVAFSPDGRYVLSASDDQSVRVWDAQSGRELHRFTGHTDDVCKAVFSPDGSYILSGSNDKTLRLWSLPH